MDNQEEVLLGGRYVLGDLLGSGGFAKVYLATDTKLRRKVAVKLLHDVVRGCAAERFRREAAIVDKLRHPHIVRVFDAELIEEPCYLVMELLQGEELGARMSLGPMVVREAVIYSCQILAALSYLQGEGVLHRDIKPANIFLAEERAVLMDFNLLLAEDLTAVTKTGMIVGTPRYMAPEIFYGADASVQSEICSFGTVLFQVLAPPDMRMNESCMGPRRDALPALAEYRDDYPKKLDEIIARATAIDPDCRYESYEAMAKELETLLGDDGATEIEEKVEQKDVAGQSKEEEKPRSGGHWLALFFVILLPIAWLWVRGPSSFSVKDLVVVAGPGTLDVTWRSDHPYPSRVEMEGKGKKRVYGKSDEPTKEHVLLISDLAEDETYSFQIVFPNGKRSLPKKIRTQRLDLEILHLKNNVLTFRCPLAKKVTLVMEDGKGKKEVEFGRRQKESWTCRLPKVKADTPRFFIEVTPQGQQAKKHRFDGAQVLFGFVKKGAKAFFDFDGKSFANSVRDLERASTKGMRHRAKARGMAIGKIFNDRGMGEAWEILYQSAPYLLETKLISEDDRYRTYKAFVSAVECSLYTFAKNAEPNIVYEQLPSIGEFALARELRTFKEQKVLLDFRKKHILFGPRRITISGEIKPSFRMKCHVDKPSSFRYGEIFIELECRHNRDIRDYLVTVYVNGRYRFPIYGLPYTKHPKGKILQVVQRIPLFALQSGSNKFELRGEQIFDFLSEDYCKVRFVALHLY